MASKTIVWSGDAGSQAGSCVMWARYPRRCSQTCLRGRPSGRGHGVTQTFRARRRRRRPPLPPAQRPSMEEQSITSSCSRPLGRRRMEPGGTRVYTSVCACVCVSVMSQYVKFTSHLLSIHKIILIIIISVLLKCTQIILLFNSVLS